jgi:predicted HicB family RNase H-like nuclease
MWKLKSQPADATQTQPPATFTDATATGVIQETQEQINAFKENSKREIAEALSKVPGKLTLRFISSAKRSTSSLL